MAEDDGDRIETLKLINAELTARLARQDSSMTRVETKAGVVVAFAATATQFLTTKHPFSTPSSTLLAVVGFAAYALAFIVGIWSMRVSRVDDLGVAALRGLAERDHGDVLRQLVGTRRLISEKNRKAADRKARAWWWSFGFFTAGLLASCACIMQTG